MNGPIKKWGIVGPGCVPTFPAVNHRKEYAWESFVRDFGDIDYDDHDKFSKYSEELRAAGYSLALFEIREIEEIPE